MPSQSEGAPVATTGTPSTPKQQRQPRTSVKKIKAYAHLTTAAAKSNDAGSRNEPRRPRFTISDAAAWSLFTLVVGVILIGACVVLTLGWPR